MGTDTTILTDGDLAEMEARAEASTPGPWVSTDTAFGDWVVQLPDDDETTKSVTVQQIWFGDMESNTGQDIRNADFVASSRADVPRLIAALREERVRSAALAEAAEATERLLIEWWTADDASERALNSEDEDYDDASPTFKRFYAACDALSDHVATLLGKAIDEASTAAARAKARS